VRARPRQPMSMCAIAAAITSVSDLEIPYDDERIPAITRRLTPTGRQNFLNELLAALAQAQATGNLRAVQEVITAWYRTAIVRSDPAYHANVRRVMRAPSKKEITLAQAQERLGV
jgi:hypothetical protein